jgi:hypothetical protein
MRTWIVAVLLITLFRCGMAQTVSPLYARGYTVIPQPQRGHMDGRDFTFNEEWKLQVDASVPSHPYFTRISCPESPPLFPLLTRYLFCPYACWGRKVAVPPDDF